MIDKNLANYKFILKLNNSLFILLSLEG